MLRLHGMNWLGLLCLVVLLACSYGVACAQDDCTYVTTWTATHDDCYFTVWNVHGDYRNPAPPEMTVCQATDYIGFGGQLNDRDDYTTVMTRPDGTTDTTWGHRDGTYRMVPCSFDTSYAGDYSITVVRRDSEATDDGNGNVDVGDGVDPDVTFQIVFHVVPSGAPPAMDGLAPREMAEVVRTCSGFYIRSWDSPTSSAANGNGGCTCTCGGNAPQPRTASLMSAGEAPRVQEPTLDEGPVGPDFYCSRRYRVYAGRCHVLGPFISGASIDTWSDGKHFVGSVSSDGESIALTTTYSNGEKTNWSGQAVWNGCSHLVPVTSQTDAYGNETIIVRSGPSSPGGAARLLSATDPAGNTWTYDRTSPSYPGVTTKIVRPDGTTVEQTLDSQGRTVQIITKSGATVLSQVDYSYRYYDGTAVVDDPGGRLCSVTIGSKTTVYDYSADNHKITVREVYRSSNWPTTADIVYTETEYLYEGVDSNEVATTTVTRKHLSGPGVDDVTVYKYWLTSDAKRNQLESITKNGQTTSYEYDGTTGLLLSATDPKDRTVSWTYAPGSADQWERPATNITVKDSSASTLSELTYDYYLDGGYPRWLKTAKDIRGNYSHYDRDSSNMARVSAVKVAAAPSPLPTTDSGWDTFWASVPDAESYTYYGPNNTDGLSGHLLTSTIPNVDGSGHDRVTTYKYSETVGDATRFFDTPSQIWCTNESGISTTIVSYTHDKMGRVLSQTDAAGKTTWFDYDPRGLLTKTTYKRVGGVADGAPEIYTENKYSPCCGLLESVRDENGDRTYYDYDDMKRVSKAWTDVQTRAWTGVSIVNDEVTNGSDYIGHPVVSYKYDNLGRVYSTTTHSDATKSSTTNCTYDANGQVTSVTYPSPIAASEYGYDGVGNLLYAKGGPESTYYTAKYDSLDRITDVYLTGSSTLPNPLPSGTGDIRVAYEGASGLATDVWRGADKHVAYSYDEYGRVKTYKPSSGPVAGVNLSYSYNSLGQKKEVKILDGSGGTVHDTTYDYSQNGSLKSINYDDSKVAEYLYNPVGLVSQIDFYSGGSATGAYDVYSYDENDPRDLLKTITMHYKDAGGQPTSSVIDYTDGAGHPNVDKAGNLLSVTDLAGHWAYTYDHGGRVSSIIPPSPVPEQGLGGSYGYNWLGQLTNPPAEPNHLQYNEAGLPSLWPGMYSYDYKANGMPAQVKSPAGTTTIASIGYDSTGLPIQLSAEGKTTQCSWDADGAYLGYNGTAGGTETQSVLTDPTTPGWSTLTEQTEQGTTVYVLDPQGSVVSTVASSVRSDHHSDAAGQTQISTGYNGWVVATYTHGPAGQVVTTSDPWGDRTADNNGGLGSIGGEPGGFLDEVLGAGRWIYETPSRYVDNSITLEPGTARFQTWNHSYDDILDIPGVCKAVCRVPEAGRQTRAFNDRLINDGTSQALMMGAGGIAEAAGEGVVEARGAARLSAEGKELGLIERRAIRNPYGSPGGPAHRGTISEIEDGLRDLGYIIRREKRFPTPGGAKDFRLPDLFAIGPDGRKTIIQAGVQDSKGFPVSREMPAMTDLRPFVDRIIFVPYK